jgi:hypothetical protein
MDSCLIRCVGCSASTQEEDSYTCAVETAVPAARPWCRGGAVLDSWSLGCVKPLAAGVF